MRFALLGALLAAILGNAALADTAAPPPAAAPQRVKGTIDTFDATARALNVKTAGGKIVSVVLKPDVRIVYNERRTLADIKAGDFIGSAAVKGTDGKFHAQEVHIFPEALRGMGEGHYGTGDATSNRSMTNATVAQVAKVAANSGTLQLTYNGAATAQDGSCGGHANAPGSTGCSGDAEIVVAPGVPVIALVLGDETLLVPGAAVLLFVVTSKDGKLESPGMTVEKGGVKPIL